MNPSSSPTTPRQALIVARGDRWSIYHRLQELEISCDCTQDGCLWVEVSHPLVALQVRSVVRQFTAPRAELLSWLQQCWQFKA